MCEIFKPDIDKLKQIHNKRILNKDKLYKLAEQNTQRNKDGLVVLSLDDEWRDEPEWDD